MFAPAETGIAGTATAATASGVAQALQQQHQPPQPVRPSTGPAGRNPAVSGSGKKKVGSSEEAPVPQIIIDFAKEKQSDLPYKKKQGSNSSWCRVYPANHPDSGKRGKPLPKVSSFQFQLPHPSFTQKGEAVTFMPLLPALLIVEADAVLAVAGKSAFCVAFW